MLSELPQGTRTKANMIRFERSTNMKDTLRSYEVFAMALFVIMFLTVAPLA